MVEEHGWTTDAVLLVVAGTGLTFGMWWIYFAVPAADLLHVRREASFVFGYLHIAAVSVRSSRPARACTPRLTTSRGIPSSARWAPCSSVVIPVGVFIGLVYVLYALLVRTGRVPSAADGADRGRAGGRRLCCAGVSMAICLLIVTLAPVVSVVGFEMLGHRHAAVAIAARVANPS